MLYPLTNATPDRCTQSIDDGTTARSEFTKPELPKGLIFCMTTDKGSLAILTMTKVPTTGTDWEWGNDVEFRVDLLKAGANRSSR